MPDVCRCPRFSRCSFENKLTSAANFKPSPKKMRDPGRVFCPAERKNQPSLGRWWSLPGRTGNPALLRPWIDISDPDRSYLIVCWWHKLPNGSLWHPSGADEFLVTSTPKVIVIRLWLTTLIPLRKPTLTWPSLTAFGVCGSDDPHLGYPSIYWCSKRSDTVVGLVGVSGRDETRLLTCWGTKQPRPLRSEHNWMPFF